MTSVSAYRVYRTTCCSDVFDEPIYSSANSSTVFDYIVDVKCVCGKKYHIDDLEFLGIRRSTIDELALRGIAEIQIPAFLRKK
jgi:hypothetical protein